MNDRGIRSRPRRRFSAPTLYCRPKLAASVVVGLLVLLMPVIAILAVIGQEEAASGLGDGTGLPPLALPFLEIYEDAAQVYKVNPFLLMAVHEDETTFGTLDAAGVRTGVNFAGCCAGPMQFSIADGATPAAGGTGATWGGYRDAYTAAKLKRPGSYPLRQAKHPNVYDSYDAIYAAAKYFSGLGAGTKLDQNTYHALLSYKGTPPYSVPYARADYERAKELEAIAAANADFSEGDISAPAVSRLAKLISVANQIEAKKYPYCFGGGHGPKIGRSGGSYCWHLPERKVYGSTDTGLDCSGALRMLLALTYGKDPGPMHSSAFGSGPMIAPGPGKHASIYYNNGHVLIVIKGRTWQTSMSNYRHGPGWTPPRGDLGSYSVSHPVGL